MGGLNDYARLNFHFLPYISMIGVDHGEISLFQDHSKLDDMGDMDTWLVWLFPILKMGEWVFQIPGKENRQHWANLVGSRKTSVYLTLGHLVFFWNSKHLKNVPKTYWTFSFSRIFGQHLLRPSIPNPLWTRPSFLAWEWRIHSIWQPNGSKQVSARINESTNTPLLS